MFSVYSSAVHVNIWHMFRMMFGLDKNMRWITITPSLPSMADDYQQLKPTAATNNKLPPVLIHRLPVFSLSFFPWINQIVNPIDPSDPLYPVHRPSARAVIVLGPSPLTSQHLDQYPSVECVVGTSAGVDHIDLAECRRRNIRVTGAGDALSEDGADYAIGLLMDVLRRMSAADRYIRAGSWPVKGYYPLGNKGENELVLWDLEVSAPWWLKSWSRLGAPLPAYNSRKKKSQVPYPFYSTVFDLATNTDALILCCSLTDERRHIINYDVLTALGKRGIIINIGRGALVDEEELVKILVRGELGGAGLDVFDNEPEVPKELFTMDNVVMSPHRAVMTPESFEALGEIIIGNLKAFFSNMPLLSELDLYH